MPKEKNPYCVIASSDQIDIYDETFKPKEKLSFKVGESYEKVSCTCTSFNESENEYLVIYLT